MSALVVVPFSACGAPTSRPSAAPAEQTIPTTATTATPATTAVGSADPAPPRRRNPGSGGGLASPIRVPIGDGDVEQRPFSEVEHDIRARIAEGCGGDQCVGIVLVDDDDPDNDTPEDCDVIENVRADETGDDGSLFVELPRGGNLVLEVNIRCEDVPRSGADGTDDVGPDGTPEDDGAPSATGSSQSATGSG